MTVHCRAFRSEDLEAVLVLREECFSGLKRDRELLRWRWQFDDNPFRRDDLPETWVLDDEGDVVGNFGMIPMHCDIDGKRYRAYDGIDLCVHPKYAGQGLARLLADRFMDPKIGDFPFVSAPVPATTHLLVSRGGSLVGGDIESLTWVAPPGELGGLTDPNTSLYCRDLDSFDSRHDDFWNALSAAIPLAITRDSTYLNWRYRDFPFGVAELVDAVDAKGDLRGIMVLQKDLKLRRIYVMELMAHGEDEEAYRVLLHEARLRAKLFHETLEMEMLAIVSRAKQVIPWLQDAGFCELGAGIPAYVGKIQVQGVLANVDDWYVSLGDGDALFSIESSS